MPQASHHTAPQRDAITLQHETADGSLDLVLLQLDEVEITLSDDLDLLGIGGGSTYLELGRAQAQRLAQLFAHPAVQHWLTPAQRLPGVVPTSA